jgi:CRISPR/Cas system endoribonuclease Cas6 (RAMP superfamily)
MIAQKFKTIIPIFSQARSSSSNKKTQFVNSEPDKSKYVRKLRENR